MTPDWFPLATRALLLGALCTVLLGAGVAVAATPAAATPADALDAEPADDPDREVAVDELANGTAWHGQTLELSGFAGNETVELVHESAGYRELAATGGSVVVDTGPLATGEWSVEGRSSGASGSFEVRSQALDARVDPAATAGNATLSLDSNRVAYEVAVTADGLDAATLDDAVAGGTVQGDRLLLDVGDASAERTVDASALPTGSHGLEVAVTDAEATDGVALTAVEELSVDGSQPLPVAGSQRYYDVTGDGDVGHRDVVAFFRNHFYPVVQERPHRFDFSGSGDVGHGDVVELFRVVATGAEPWNASASIADAPAEVAAGDALAVDLDVDGSEDARVELSDGAGEYEASVRLEDVGDGPVTLRANTFEMANGTPAAAFEAEGASIDADATTESGPLATATGRLQPGTTLTVAVGTDAGPAGPDDSTEVGLVAGGLERVETHVAPASATPETPAAVRAAATERDDVATGDLLVLEVEAPGVAAGLPDDPASLGERGLSVEIVGPDPYLGEPERTTLAERPDAAALVPEPAAGRFYVVVDTATLPADRGDGASVAVTADGDAHPTLAAGENWSVTDSFGVSAREVGFVDERALDERIPVAPGSNATVRAETNVAPGTDVRVRVDAAERFVTGSGTVARDGTVAVPVDLEGADVGDRLRHVRVTEDGGGTTVEAPGLAVPPDQLLGEDLVVDASAPDDATAPANETLQVVLEHAGDDAGYAVALVEVRGEPVDLIATRLEPGEERSLDYQLPARAAGIVDWSVRAAGDRDAGTVEVTAPRATVDASVVGAPRESTVEVPIRTTDDPETVYVDLRRPNGSYYRGLAIHDPAETVTLRWNATATGSAFAVEGGDLESIGRIGFTAGHGEYELHTGTRKPIVTHADDVTPVVVDATNPTAVYGGTTGDAIELPLGSAEQEAIDAVTVGAADGVYEARLNVTGDDGSLALSWDTHAATLASAGAGFAAEHASVSLANLTAPGEHLEAGRYELAVERDGTVVERSAIELREPSLEGVHLHAAPGVGVDDPERQVEHAVERGAVARDDALVVEVRANGIDGSHPAGPRELADAGLRLAVERADGGASVPLQNLTDAEVVRDPARDRVFVVLDPASFPGSEVGQTWTVTATLDGDASPHLPEGETQTATESFDYEERRLRIAGPFEGDRLVLPPEGDAPVTAHTNVAPGTQVSVRANLPRDFRTAVTTVEPDGTAEATIDLAEFDAGTVLRLVRVRAPNSDAQETVEGVIRRERHSFGIDADAPSSVEVGDDAALDVTVENHGEHYERSAEIEVGVDGETVVDVTVPLAPGEQWVHSISLPTAESGDVTWSVDTQHDSASGTVTVRAPVV